MSIIIGKMIMSKTMLTIECFILINKQRLNSVEIHTISSLFSYFFPLFEWKCGFYSGCFLTSKNWSWFLRCIIFNIKSINFDFNCSGYMKINMRLLKTISILNFFFENSVQRQIKLIICNFMSLKGDFSLSHTQNIIIIIIFSGLISTERFNKPEMEFNFSYKLLKPNWMEKSKL